MTTASNPAPGAVPATSSRNVWLIGGALALATAAGAAGLALRAPATPTPAAESLAAGESIAPAAKTGLPVPPAAKAAVAERAPAAKTAQTAPTAAAKPATRPAPVTTTAQAAAACVDCGTVQSVRDVVRKGEGSGVGAVAGGVVGAVIGNQVGDGSGRKVATVIGAIGGGMAGHEIEKRSKSTNVHEVRVKMDDGSVRTLEVAEKPALGARVQVDGRTLKPLAAGKA